MPDALEASLARALRQAAEAAPEPPDDDAEGLLRERARRAEAHTGTRGRLMIAAAAVTVLILLLAAVTAVKLFRSPDIHPISPPVRIEHTGYQDGAAIADVWPGAVRTVPATIPIKGRQNGFNIERVLPDGQLVVIPVGDDPDIPHLWVLDPKTGKARAVSPSGEPVLVVAQQADAGDARWIAWIALRAGDNSVNAPAYLWYAPAAGGKARKALSTPISNSHEIDGGALRLLISKDTVVISPALKPEPGHAVLPIRTVRLGGNRVSTVKDSASSTVLQWPWLSDTRTPGNQTIRNAGTGEVRQAKAPKSWTDVNCSLSWCVGQDGKRIMAARRDGSDARALDTGELGTGQLYSSIVQDRFLFGSGRTVYDLMARKTLTLPLAAGERSATWNTFGVIGEGGGTPLIGWSKTGASGQPESCLLIDLQAMV